MPVAFKSIRIDQGQEFQLDVQTLNSDRTVMDLTGWQARMQVRPTKQSVTVLLSASTTDGRITINAPGGIIMVRIGADVTAPLTFSDAVYDLEIYQQADITKGKRIAEGFVSLSPEVTR